MGYDKHKKMVGVYLPPTLAVEARSHAKRSKTSFSRFVEAAIRAALRGRL